jgi:hypothetical protein
LFKVRVGYADAYGEQEDAKVCNEAGVQVRNLNLMTAGKLRKSVEELSLLTRLVISRLFCPELEC